MIRRICIFLIACIIAVIVGSVGIVVFYRLFPSAIPASAGIGTAPASEGASVATDEPEAETVQSTAAESESDTAPTDTEPPETTPPEEPVDTALTVIIDPGHGFDDPGCVTPLLGDTYEYELTLDMAHILGTKLEDAGHTVIYTHEGESFPALSELSALADSLGVEYEIEKCVDNSIFSAYERTVWANCIAAQQEIDLFISIHVNAMPDGYPERSGFEIDYCTDTEWARGAKIFFDSIIEAVRKSYPTTVIETWEDSWDEAFIVTKRTFMPSILFETGFATNEQDAARLLDPAERERLMEALAEGIMTAEN